MGENGNAMLSQAEIDKLIKAMEAEKEKDEKWFEWARSLFNICKKSGMSLYISLFFYTFLYGLLTYYDCRIIFTITVVVTMVVV